MKHLVCGILLLAVAACSSNEPGSNDNTGGIGSTGGSGSTTNCGTATPTLLYSTANKVLRAPATDEEFVYFIEDLVTINKIPKAGGSATLLATPPSALLDVTIRLYVDGPKLYFSDNNTLFAVDKAAGMLTPLATSGSSRAIGIDPTLAFDDQYIYFGDKVAGDAGEPQGTVNRLPKAGGSATVLASGQAGPGTIAFDDANLYWINEGTYTSEFKDLHNGGVATVPKAGGSVRALYTQTSVDGISPDIGDLIVTSSNLYFSSINLNNFSNTGEYKLPKIGGTPQDFSSCTTGGAFLANGQLYANCGDSISKFDLETGSETQIVCLPTEQEGALIMTHDATTMYYVKLEHQSASGRPYSIYSVPIE